MADRHHFEKPLNRHNSETVRRITMKFGKMTHYDLLKPGKGQKFDFFLNQQGGLPMSRHVRSQHTQSDSAGDSTGTVRMPIVVYCMGVHIGAT